MGSGLSSTTQETTKESGDKLIDYNKEDWIDMKQKVKWGNEWHHHYRTPDNKYDILHIEADKKRMEEVIMFPIKNDSTKTHDDLVKIVADTLVRLNI